MEHKRIVQDAQVAKVYTDIETRPLYFTEEELALIRETKIYQQIEKDPAEILLITCSYIATNRTYNITRLVLLKRHGLKLTQQVFNYIRLREPYLSVIKRFKELLEARLHYIPIYSKQVRLKELQTALDAAKKIEDVPTRTKSVVEIIRAAQSMVEGKKIKVDNTTNFNMYASINATVKEIAEKNKAERMAQLINSQGVKTEVPIYTNGHSK